MAVAPVDASQPHPALLRRRHGCPPDALSAIRAEDQPGKRVLEHKLLPNPGGGLAGKTDLLRKLEILLRHQRRMQALKRLIGRRVL